MSTAHEQLAQIARQGESRYSQTALADGHAHVTRRVRRHRTTRAAATTVAGIGVVGAASWGGLAMFGSSTDALPPGGSSSASGTPAATASTPAEVQAVMGDGEIIGAWIRDTAFVLGLDAADLTAALAEAAPGNANPEGWIKPGTYFIPGDATAAQAADLLVAQRISQFETLGVPREQWQSVLTEASLVDREAMLDVDKPKVARVIENRLEQGMRLELDSTITYISGSEGPFTTDTERAADSPYNTYKYAGLPPGAIASPSDASIDAVLNPAEGDWLFFVTVNYDTGKMAFATTFEDHQADVELLQQWVKDKATE